MAGRTNVIVIDDIGDDSSWLRTRDYKKQAVQEVKAKSSESMSLLKQATAIWSSPPVIEGKREERGEKKPSFY
jgi:hypothetical protein